MFPIFIPSKGRPHSKLFERVSGAIVVVEPDEYPVYRLNNPNINFMVLPESNQGIAFARQFILDSARKCGLEWYWTLDDDLTCFYEIQGNKSFKRPALEVLSSAEKLFRNLPSVAQACLEFGQYACHSKRDIKGDSHCEAAVCINVERTRSINYSQDFLMKEDKDFSLQCLKRGLTNIRIQKYAVSTAIVGTKKGGLYNLYSDPTNDQKYSDLLMKKWGPNYVKVVRKATGRVDVRVQWAKIALDTRTRLARIGFANV